MIEQKKKLKKIRKKQVNLSFFENRLYSTGINYIAGVDEAGRGSLAGPVVAGSVILPAKLDFQGIDDSKKLTPKQREYCFELIINNALSWSVFCISSAKIDEINILQASLLAMRKSVSKLKIKPDYILIDGPNPIGGKIVQQPIIRGDSKSISIAAASIIAKVTRDRIMNEYEKKFSDFSFSHHKGYGTKKHMLELKKYGPTPIHRMTYAPVKLFSA